VVRKFHPNSMWEAGTHSKESGPRGPGFGSPPEEAFDVFPSYGSLLE